jgi:short subunit dehydrogenase-like uncharacterized protein/uncharacterized protein YceK
VQARSWLHGLLLGLAAGALGCQTIRSFDYGCPGVYSGTRSYNERLKYLPLDGKIFYTLDLPFTLIADTLALPCDALRRPQGAHRGLGAELPLGGEHPPLERTRVARPDRLDVALFGATGFTGRLTALALARRSAGPPLRWAIAGRDRARLERVRDELARQGARAPDALLEADVGDAASLGRLAAAARVVATSVGPYAEYGEPVVAACVREGAHYADLTGEPGFVARSIERHHAAARERGLRIVHCCGFDCIPADLGALLAVRHLPPGRPIQLDAFVRGAGGFSGGTWHSALGAMSRGLRERRAAGARERSERGAGRRARGRARVHFVRELGDWACPLPTIDTEIVLRSARMLEDYGPDFEYGHHARVSSLPVLVAGALGVGAIFALAQLGPTRRLLGRIRKPGEGPSEEQRARARFQVTLLGRAGDARVRVEVRGGDPGYGETSKMLAESALCLAQDGERLPPHAGVLTPAVAMGEALVQRLRAAGIAFDVAAGR